MLPPCRLRKQSRHVYSTLYTVAEEESGANINVIKEVHKNTNFTQFYGMGNVANDHGFNHEVQ